MKISKLYYSTSYAIKRAKKENNPLVFDLSLPSGNPNAGRMLKGGKNDGKIAYPWLLVGCFNTTK
jgi:hypothetical protein